MTTIATRADEAAPATSRWLSVPWLSGRLILLTAAFSILAQMLVFVPSLNSYLYGWTFDRIRAAQMVAVTLAATPAETRPGELETSLAELLRRTQAIGVRGNGTRWLLAGGGRTAPVPEREVDLREPRFFGPFLAALRVLARDRPALVRVTAPGVPGVAGAETVEILLEDRVFLAAAAAYTRSFFAVSLLIAAITGVLLYLALHLVVVRPVRRLATNIEGFARQPEDVGRIIVPSDRKDEIGRAEQALARMETVLANELRQKRRLADLGLAVSKINHELRNLLTTAQLLGDRLGEVDDPAVRRVAPRLIRTLDRAVAFCGATLAYGRANEPAPERRAVPLLPLVEEQSHLADLSDGWPIAIDVEVGDDLVVDADPEQLGRVLLNLIRNAVEALSQARTPAARIVVTGWRLDGSVAVRVSDNGPGVPERLRNRLFSAFQASERTGGTGLGLPVAAEIVRAHGGTIEIEAEAAGGTGASFVVVIPDGAALRTGGTRGGRAAG